MRKLLFVPVVPQTPQALELALRQGPETWLWHVAPNPSMAREQLAQGEWDAIVADFRSEEGRGFLAEICEAFPEVVRIGVSGRAPGQHARVSAVHQTISAPLNFAELDVAIERSCRLQGLLQGERICSVVGKVEELPAAPTVFAELMRALNQPDISVKKVSTIIEGDTAISAKLLQLVNSSIFRTSRTIATVSTAVSFLGLEVVKNLVLSLGVFKAFEHLPSSSEFSLEEMQAHSRLTAAIAGRLPLAKETLEAAVVASLLHDIGKLVLAYKMPDRFQRLLRRAQKEQRPLYRIEEEMWGITHAEIGAYLLGLWGLPIEVTEAIAYHHAPSLAASRGLDVIAAVHLANLLAHENDQSYTCEWNQPFLDRLGGAVPLADLKIIAQEVCLLPQV